ncbi:MAG TPA: hypothetical protein VMW45_04985 [Dehalococcoidia bacterium]|jgi:hypothetical protein|nr:hypothetical protein [Dehalococcoidia bacterium]
MMAVLERIKSLFKRPKAKVEAERPKPEAKVAEEKAPEAGEKKSGEA